MGWCGRLYSQWENVHRTGVLGYIDGYNQCLEDNKDKKYTDDDMRNCWMESWSASRQMSKYMDFMSYIQSLQPKTEWEVEIVDGKIKLKQWITN